MGEAIFLESGFLGMPAAEFLPIVISVLAIILFAIFVYFNMRNQEKVARVAREVQRITNSIGAGVVEYIPYDDGFITYASRGFYTMLGYTKEEFKEEFNNHLFGIILPEYREKAMNVETKGKERFVNQELCIKTKTGVRWFLLTGNFEVRKNGVGSVSAILVDISKDKEMAENLRIEQERYRLATELSNDVIFNYRLTEDEVHFSDNFKKFFGGDSHVKNFRSESKWRSEVIYRDDQPVFDKMMSDIIDQKEEIDIQLRLRSSDGSYIWCRIVAMTIRNVEGSGQEIVGKIMNIERHKQELSRLEKKAMKDPMTGAYNKTSTRGMIESYIARYADMPGMLLMVDIDKFKDINDTYGHLAGDHVLIRVVTQITSAFRGDDIIGRIGGDEFVVFVGNIRNRTDLLKQAKKLREVLRTPVEYEGKTIPMSASIGISLYPEHGTTYDALIERADTALYQVKGSTRDNFIIYGEAKSSDND